MITATERRRLRRIAHHLKPLVTIGEGGISEAVSQEADRALGDHELVKLKVNLDPRHERSAAVRSLTESLDAELIQTIGKVAVLFRANPDADPRLSNLKRFEDL